jgi:hypothetical protein
MFIFFLCGAPQLFEDAPIDLTLAGSMVTRKVHAPVDMNYHLQAAFEFPSTTVRVNDQVIGQNYTKHCMGLAVSNFDLVSGERIRYEDIPDIERSELGHPIPFRVVIRTANDRSIVVEETFESLCTRGWSEKFKFRDIAWVHLPIGDYVVDVTNLEAQPDLNNVNTTISLRGLTSK